MHGIDVRMEYDRVEELIAAFRRAVEEVTESSNTMSRIAAMIEESALVHEQGDLIVDALRSSLIPILRRGIMGLEEVVQDLDGAVRDMRDGDINARSRFSN
jgi:hypothetical protein